MSNVKKLMMAAAAGDANPVNVEDVFGSQGFYGDNQNIIQGVGHTLPTLAATTEFSYAMYGPGDYDDSGYLSSACSGCDSQGNIYIATRMQNNTPGTDRGVVVQKYSPHFKEVLWKKAIQRTDKPDDNIQPYQLIVSDNDNLYLMTLGPSNSAGTTGTTVTRINTSTGAIIWSKGYPETGSDAPSHVSEDSSGTYVYVSHYAYDGNANHPMLSKLAVSNGAASWDKVYYWATYDAEEAYGVQVLGSSVYLCGYSRPGSDRYSFLVKASTSDGSVQDALRWSHTSNHSQYAYDITTDGTNIYVTGGGVGGGYFIAKFDSSFNFTYKSFYDSPSSTNTEGRSIHYGSDGKLTVFASGEINILETSRQGHAIIKHDPSNLNQITGSIKAWHTGNAPVDGGINGSGSLQTLWFRNTRDAVYTYNVCQFDVTDLENLGTNPVMGGLWEPTFDTTVTNPYTNTSNPDTANGRQAWTNNSYTVQAARPVYELSTGYYPEVLAADAGGIAMYHCINGSANKVILDNNIDSGGDVTALYTNLDYAAVPGDASAGARFGTAGLSVRRGYNWQGQNYANVFRAFRKYPKFFDVVSYNGTGSSTSISHNLGSVPGMIWIKCISTGSTNWFVYHKSAGAGKFAYLNTNNAFISNTQVWQNTSPTSSQFYLGVGDAFNGSGKTYVAYLFADHDGDGTFGPNGDMDIIKCGSYYGNGASINVENDIGFEPQFMIIKNINSSGDWLMVDTETNFTYTRSSNTTNYMFTGRNWINNTDQVGRNKKNIRPFSNGFQVQDTDSNWNGSGQQYLWMAIRKPTRMATEYRASDLFHTAWENTISRPEVLKGSGGKDMFIGHVTSSASGHPIIDRTHGRTWYTQSTSGGDAGGTYDNYFKVSESNEVHWGNVFHQRAFSGYPGYHNMWKQAGGFFDIVAYTGNDTAGHQVPHQLQVAPAMMWVKKANATGGWFVYHKAMDLNGDSSPETDVISLTSNATATDSVDYWNDTAPTDTHFTLGDTQVVNGAGSDFVAYLFGETTGVTKMGSYTGNGSSTGPIVDCGFYNSPSYLLIKSYSGSNENWVHFNAVRGLGNYRNDYYMTLNTTDTENTGANWIEPTSTGFQLKNGGTLLNGNGTKYIFYAIA